MRHTPRYANSILAGGIAILIGVSACGSSMTERPVEPPVDAITIRQVADTIDVGQTVAFSASLRAGGVEVANNGALRWASSSPDALNIDSLTGSGRASDVSAPSTVTVTAKLNSLSATSSFVVFPKVTGLTIVVPSDVAVGRTMTPKALVPSSQAGGPTQVSSAWGVRFESANPAALRINTDGTMSAIAPGTSRVTVDVHGKRDSANVTVIPGYAVTLLPGTDGVSVVDVNDGGDVVGSSGVQSTLIRGGQQIALGSCDVQGINNRGQVLCSTKVYDNGVFTDLFEAGALQGRATGIDETGAVFGMLTQTDSRAFLWRSGTIDVYPRYGGAGLASTGRVAAGSTGLGTVLDLHPYATLLRPNGAVSCLCGGDHYSQANDINGSENVVGFSGKFDGRYIVRAAIVWLKSDGYNGRFFDSRASSATGISEGNDVVGGGGDGAFLWKDGRYDVLSDVVSEGGWTFAGSPQISRNGTIAVSGTNIDGRKGIVLIKLR